MAETFFISDTHFDHDAIRIHCGRPWKDTDAMNQAMVQNWNGIVGRKDTVIIGGDFAWKRHTKWINELHGKKIMVFGNHDHMSVIARQQFSRCVGGPKEGGILQMALDKQCFIVCHYPMWSWNASFHGSWHFYGHAHGRKAELAMDWTDGGCDTDPPPRMHEFQDGLSCAIDADVWNYTPIPWEVLKLKMQSRIAGWKSRRASWSGKESANTRTRIQQLAEANAEWRERVGNATG
jgi:calcineurin-like phosphoesterase family protein